MIAFFNRRQIERCIGFLGGLLGFRDRLDHLSAHILATVAVMAAYRIWRLSLVAYISMELPSVSYWTKSFLISGKRDMNIPCPPNWKRFLGGRVQPVYWCPARSFASSEAVQSAATLVSGSRGRNQCCPSRQSEASEAAASPQSTGSILKGASDAKGGDPWASAGMPFMACRLREGQRVGGLPGIRPQYWMPLT